MKSNLADHLQRRFRVHAPKYRDSPWENHFILYQFLRSLIIQILLPAKPALSVCRPRWYSSRLRWFVHRHRNSSRSPRWTSGTDPETGPPKAPSAPPRTLGTQTPCGAPYSYRSEEDASWLLSPLQCYISGSSSLATSVSSNGRWMG